MNISIYLPDKLLGEVKSAAARDHRSVSSFIRVALNQHFQENQRKNTHENARTTR